MNKDTRHVMGSFAIIAVAVAAVGFVGESDYSEAVASHERRCDMMRVNLNDKHRDPIDRRGWPEQYPGQYAAECGEESER